MTDAERLAAEQKAHARTQRQLDAVRLNASVNFASWCRETAELIETRTKLDRSRLEASRLEALVRARDEECEALRNQVAVLARAAGGGAVL